MMGAAAGLAAGAAAGLAVAAAGAGLLVGLLRRWGVMDVPNERSSHTSPAPRGGGIAIIAGALAGLGLQAWLWDAQTPGPHFWIGFGGIALAGFADDIAGLPAGVKLAAQAVCAALAVEGAGGLSRLPLPAPLDLAVGPAAGWALSFAWVVGVTNIYNFLDGIDGFAGLQGVAACGALAAMQVSPAVTPLLAAAAGGCAGFLIWNWHPARIFMGDVGSTALGFLIATAPLHAAEQARPQAVLATGLALWFFLSDGVYTLARRAARGEKFWQPHRTHLYQLLARAGWRHDRVAARVGGAGVALAGLAAAAYRTGSAGLMWGACLLAAAGFAVYWKRAGAHGGAPGIGGGEPCKP